MKFSCICPSEKNQKWILYESPFEGKQEHNHGQINNQSDRGLRGDERMAIFGYIFLNRENRMVSIILIIIQVTIGK